MRLKTLLDPAGRLIRVKLQNAVFRVSRALGEVGDEPVLPQFLPDRRIVDDRDASQQRDAVATSIIANAGFGVLLEVARLGGVAAGRHPDRFYPVGLDLGHRANARVPFLRDRCERHHLAFRQ